MKLTIKIKRSFEGNQKNCQKGKESTKGNKVWRILPAILFLLFFCFTFRVPASFANSDEINSDKVIISEFMVNPRAVADTAGEWLELYNTGSESVNLNNWLIETQKGQHLISQDLLIAPAEHLVICKNSNFNENGNIPCSYQYSGITLVNTTGQIRLINNDQVVFELGYVAEMISEGKSTELTELIDTDIESTMENDYSLPENWHFSFNQLESLDFGTPGEINSSLPENPNNPESEISEINNTHEEDEPITSEDSILIPTTYSTIITPIILITEILPNPTGTDGNDNEFIEFYNPNTYPVDLLGWKISNKKEQEYAFKDSFIINPASYAIIYRKDFNLTLYNEDGSITIFNEKNESINNLSFNGLAKNGQSLNRDLSENIFWSSSISPGTSALEPQDEDSELNQESQSSESFTKINQSDQLDFLENLSPVSMKGLVVSPPGIPQQHSFYLQQKNWGILIEAPGSFKYKQGDYLEIKGVLHQTQKYNYIKTASVDDLKKIKSKKVSYYDLNKCLMEGSCLKRQGSAVKFIGEFLKKTATALYFKNKNYEMELFLPNNLYFDISTLEKGDIYEIKGVLEKTSSVFRILATNQDSLILISKKSKGDIEKSTLDSKSKIISPTSQKTEKQIKESFSSLLKNPIVTKNKITIIENLSEPLEDEMENETVIFSLRKKSHDYLINIMKIFASMA